MTRTQTDVQQVWREYKRTHDRGLRNELIERYLPLVKYNAERIHVKLPDEVAVDDLISAGIFGLIAAIEAFDLSREVKFETYCAPRIRGAILDELRTWDWVPRLVRIRAHQVQQARRELELEMGRAPVEEELASYMGLSREELDKLIRDATAVGLVSLSRKFYETDSSKDVREIDLLQDRRVSDPLTEAHKRDVKEAMTRGLSRAEALILILYYYEQMTMKEIGQTLDLSESRVSQIHSSILARLRAQLDRRKQELPL
jgi:RNA polymerase sigma factor for flagellar operon FliA